MGFDYIWGDALDELYTVSPELRLINLETAVTTSEHYWPGKGINYRMHPANLPCLTAAGIDGCILANNHVMDWGREGLEESLASLAEVGLKSVGAGLNRTQAIAPALFELPGRRRVLLFGFGHPSSGVPPAWRASAKQAGVNLLENLSEQTVDQIARQVFAIKRPGDLVLVSIHWGGNWGYRIPQAERSFAHALIDQAGVDLVHGHSSHHPKGIEVYHDRLILYGCGDLINDYEGISGYEVFRDDLSLMYFPTLDPLDGRLLRLVMTPMQIQRFRLQRPTKQDRNWLARTMDRECAALGTRVRLTAKGRLELI